MEIKDRYVFAAENHCPATRRLLRSKGSRKRWLPKTGLRVISLFPAEELPRLQPLLNRKPRPGAQERSPGHFPQRTCP